MAHSIIRFDVGESRFSLSRRVVKSYLPHLWRVLARNSGFNRVVDLERLVATRTDASHLALRILLHALKAPEQGLGPSTELKGRLTEVIRRLHSGHKRSPEPVSSKVFTKLASHLQRLSRHQELTYAMSEWFAIHAAENNLSRATLFAYIIALDHLGADMTAPLNAFMRTGPVSPAKLQILALERQLRPKTIKMWRKLCQDQMKELGSARCLSPQLVAGGKVDIEELVEQYRRDPDSIIIDLSNPRHCGGTYDLRDHEGHCRPRRRRSLDDCHCSDYTPHDIHCAAYGHPPWMLDQERLIRPSMHRFHSLPYHHQRFIANP
ncbi:MAG: hypothetical protein Q9174_004883 [Haloplaca sp. 1 TL-2023]